MKKFRLTYILTRIFCFLFFLFQAPYLASGQWQQLNNAYDGHVYGVVADGADILIGSNETGIFKSSDSGNSWAPSNSGLPETNIVSLKKSGSKIFAGTYSKGLFVSTDKGASWSPDTVGMGVARVLELAYNSSNLYAVTYTRGIYMASLSGGPWISIGSGLLGGSSLAVNGSQIFVGAGAGKVYLSNDNGVKWDTLSTINTYPVLSLVTTGTKLFAATSNGLYLSTDTGKTWNEKNTGLYGLNISAVTVMDTTMFCGNTYGRIYKSTNYGTVWTSVYSLSYNSYAVNTFEVDGSTLYAGASGHGLIGSFDKGTSWTYFNNGITDTNVETIFFNGNNIYASGILRDQYIGTGILKSTDNGATWAPKSVGLAERAISSIIADDSDLLASTISTINSLYISKDSANTWKKVGALGSTNFSINVLLKKDTLLFAATEGDGVKKSSDNGATWTASYSGFAFDKIDEIISYNDKLYISDGGTIHESDDNGSSWKRKFDFYDILQAIFRNGSNIVAAPFEEGIWVSTDSGTTWNKANAGSINYQSVLVFAAYGTTLFAGTNGFGVYVSTDNGLNWVPANNSGLIKKRVYELTIKDQELFAGTDSGLIWKSSILDAVGIETISRFESISIYPNPAATSSAIHVQTPLNRGEATLYNSRGAVIWRKDFNDNNLELKSLNLETGLFLLQIRDDEHLTTARLIIQ